MPPPKILTPIARPMLAANPGDLERMRFPQWGSEKLDGIRALAFPTLGLVSRSLKPIPNRYIRHRLSYSEFYYMDGEIITYDEDGYPDEYNTVQSKVMTQAGESRFIYKVFDLFEYIDSPFVHRTHALQKRVTALHPKLQMICEYLPQEELGCLGEVKRYGRELFASRKEGAILRDPWGPYKQGRATYLQGWMTKWVEYKRAEGIVIGFKELYRNTNAPELDNLGYTKRSSHKAGKVPADTLGSLILKTEWGELDCGSGLDDTMRDLIWNAKTAYLGRSVTFKYKPHGMKTIPRHPIFLGFRHEDDASEDYELIKDS